MLLRQRLRERFHPPFRIQELYELSLPGEIYGGHPVPYGRGTGSAGAHREYQGNERLDFDFLLPGFEHCD